MLLAWSLSHRLHSLVTTSSKVERLNEYLRVFEVKLSSDDIAAIDEAGSKLYFRKFWDGKDFQDK